jgi:hypothetical protein
MKPTRIEWTCGLLALLALWSFGYVALSAPLMFAKDNTALALMTAIVLWTLGGILVLHRYIGRIRPGSAKPPGSEAAGSPDSPPQTHGASPPLKDRPRKFHSVKWTLKFTLGFFGWIALWIAGILVGCLPNILHWELSDLQARIALYFFVGSFFACPVGLFLFILNSSRAD